MSDRPVKDDAHTGGGIGDIPAQPVNPATVGSGRTDPRHDSSGVASHDAQGDEPGERGVEETEAHPS